MHNHELIHVEINGEEIDDVYEMNVENINNSGKNDNIHLYVYIAERQAGGRVNASTSQDRL